MSAKHINKYDFRSEGVLATNNNNMIGQLGSKEGEEEDTETTTEKTEETETSTEFRYPAAWKDKLPQFPFVPREDEVTRAPVRTGWEDGQMPVFPFSSATVKKPAAPQK